ncbi:hypothetical protein [Microcoleus sp. herbarium7]|uniref:hypothetical protein n=1 Tax=Microcoleus sp. herbarium7 TaxID=3055435 RepID=UPI002FCED306
MLLIEGDRLKQLPTATAAFRSSVCSRSFCLSNYRNKVQPMLFRTHKPSPPGFLPFLQAVAKYSRKKTAFFRYAVSGCDRLRRSVEIQFLAAVCICGSKYHNML